LSCIPNAPHITNRFVVYLARKNEREKKIFAYPMTAARGHPFEICRKSDINIGEKIARIDYYLSFAVWAWIKTIDRLASMQAG
jgi:hypothetical protein